MEQTKLKRLESIHPSARNVTNEHQIEDLVSKLISDEFHITDENELLFQIIKYTRCNEPRANEYLSKMKELGLKICHHSDYGYSIRRFANMRGYLSDYDLEELNRKSIEKTRKNNPKIASFMQKHGADKTLWSEEIADEFEYEVDCDD